MRDGICLSFLGLALLVGCAHTPVTTESLVNGQQLSKFGKTLNCLVLDAREEKFRKEQTIVKYGIPVATYSAGDPTFDTPLNRVFEKMVFKRFGNDPNGNSIEFKLKSFHTACKPNAWTGVPVLGILAAGADAECLGVLRVDVSVLDKEKKFVFRQSYEANITRAVPTVSSEEANQRVIAILGDVFDQFAEELETDLSRVRSL